MRTAKTARRGASYKPHSLNRRQNPSQGGPSERTSTTAPVDHTLDAQRRSGRGAIPGRARARSSRPRSTSCCASRAAIRRAGARGARCSRRTAEPGGSRRSQMWPTGCGRSSRQRTSRCWREQGTPAEAVALVHALQAWAPERAVRDLLRVQEKRRHAGPGGITRGPTPGPRRGGGRTAAST